MRIGFDAKRASGNSTGLGNYSRYTIEILSEFYPDNEYVLFTPKRNPHPRLQTIRSRSNVRFVYPSGGYRFFSSLWRSRGVARDIAANGISIFHGLSNELPMQTPAGAKTVVTVHDLIFLRYPQFYKPADRAIYRFKFRSACRRADRIIAVSECTKRDIVSFFRIPEEKINVVYQGCDPVFATAPSEETKRRIAGKYGLPPVYLLNVGSIESRKNLLLAVKALKRLPAEIHLVAVGKSTPYRTETEKYAAQAGLGSRLHLFDNVPTDDLPALYRMASVFVYPSFFEGFGIPIIEALTSGTPVVAATGSCLEEAGGAHSLYVDPNDDEDLSAKIISILNNSSLAAQMREKGREYAQRFSGAKIAAEMMNIYREVVR
ncbi:MAG: glycosyltransferase family 4 protein [Prevotellaceae bacterium]|nr:glycosyltransferase family 4 protein [Prevotellaceae bacterium]